MDQNPQLWKQSAGATGKQASQMQLVNARAATFMKDHTEEVSLKTTTTLTPCPPIPFTETVSAYWCHPWTGMCQGCLPSTSTRIRSRAACSRCPPTPSEEAQGGEQK